MENQNRFYIYVLCLSVAAYTSAFLLTTSSDRATAGWEFNFTCSNFQPKYNNTLVNISRYNESKCMAYVTYDGRCLYILNHTISYTCICYYSSITLTVPGTFDKDKLNGSRWTCGSQIQGEVSNPVKLYVDIPILKVNLTSNLSDENLIKVVSDSKHQFICTTEASQSAARIQWYLSGTDITHEASAQPSVCSAGCETVISSSILSYIGNIKDNGKTMYCTAVNVEGESVNSTMKSIDILYKPMIAKIPDYNITERQTLSITCTVVSNPDPISIWWTRQHEPGFRFNSANLTISNINRNDNGSYTCHAMNILTPSGMSLQNRTSQNMFHVNVQYYPVISDIPDYNVTEGNTLSIFPIIDANPQPTLLSWSRRDENEVVYKGFNLTISNIQRNFSGNYTFLVRNTLKPSGMQSQERTSRKMFHVNVQYQPVISDIPDYNVTEGNDIKLCPVIDANPQPKLLWWTRQHDFIYYGSNLTIKNIQRNSSGNYTCHVMNTLTPSGKSPQNRTSQKMFYVNVQYQPVISDIQDYNVTEGNDLGIFPNIDANPQPTLFWWSRRDEREIRNISTSSYLKISNIQRKFSGNYTFLVRSTLTPSGMPSDKRISKKTFHVEVQYQPFFLEMEDHNVTEGNDLQIYPVIDANPQPTMLWWTRQNDFIYYDSNLTIKNIQRNSSGNYTCLVMNTLTPSGKSPQNRTSQKMFYVNVQYQPAISDIPDYNVTEGNTLGIFPIIDANPQPTLLWWSRRDENDVVYNGLNLTISNIQRNYSGNYTFLVRNTLTPSGMPSQERTSKKMFHVNVQYQAVISEIQDYNITEGNDLKIYPVIDANPYPTLLWWTSQDNFTYYGSNLTITNIQRNSSGNYTCHVMNILTPSGKSPENRTSQKMFYVNVQYQPIIAEINDINITEGSSLAIYPVIDSNPQSTSVWWSRQSEPDFRFYDTNFTISNIQRKSSGSYIFNAVNILTQSGWPPQKKTSQKMCNVNVQYKPILSGSPDYDTEEGGTLTLSPTIDANPSPTYIWWTRENHTSFIYYDVPLIIKNIKQIDSGSYIVYVMNTLTPSGMPETNLTSQKVYNINVTVSTGPIAQDTSVTSDNSIIIGAGVGAGVIFISILVIGVMIFISRKRQINRRNENSNERVYESTPNGQGRLSNREMHVYNDLGNVAGARMKKLEMLNALELITFTKI
ncbi:hemicentin-1-like isoform X2 [Mytilus galloprovincialis]|uniref:hemicentin-1-like isoform X2 n=1 Tax=Mytilus galloprovincialis TaxID=29158 RepID=UPI003F7C9BBC